MQPIRLSLEYYDTIQKNLFQAFPNALQLDNLVQTGISISKDELLAYMMFTEQAEENGVRTYDDLRNKVNSRLGDIEDYLAFNNGSVQSNVSSARMMSAGFTERLGVALGLCALNRIHGLTAADWKKIPEVRGRRVGHPTFDFEIPIASTGTDFIQAENKGSIVKDNSQQNDPVHNHYRSIIRKKTYVRQEEAKMLIPIHQNLYYGTIGVLNTRANSTARVLLVDPPAFEIDMKPDHYKLLARLHYYLDEFRNIGVKEKIIRAFKMRLEELENSSDYLKYNNVPLDYKYPRLFHLFMDGKMFAAVDNNEAFGRIFIIERKQRILPYLVAFPKALLRMIILQNFEGILKYEYNPDFINENIQVLMRFRSKDIKEYNLPDNLKFVFNERRKYFETTYFGKVSHSTDGRIFGLLDSEIQNR